MASKEKIKAVIATIKTLYPYYAKDTSVEALLLTWGKLLNKYSDEIVEAALIMALETCTNPPVPADIIKFIKEIERTASPSDEEMWVLLAGALKETNVQVYKLRYPEYGVDHRAKIEAIWESLPSEVKQYLGGIRELRRMSNLSSEELKYEKPRFLKRLPTIRERIEYDFPSSLPETRERKSMIGESSSEDF